MEHTYVWKTLPLNLSGGQDRTFESFMRAQNSADFTQPPWNNQCSVGPVNCNWFEVAVNVNRRLVQQPDNRACSEWTATLAVWLAYFCSELKPAAAVGCDKSLAAVERCRLQLEGPRRLGVVLVLGYFVHLPKVELCEGRQKKQCVGVTTMLPAAPRWYANNSSQPASSQASGSPARTSDSERQVKAKSRGQGIGPEKCIPVIGKWALCAPSDN